MDQTCIKLFALIFMTIDHIGEFIPGAPLFFRYIGRLAGSMYFFCSIEGYTHTRSKKEYLIRLYFCAQIMTFIDVFLPFLLFQMHQLEYATVIPNNTFLELFGVLFWIYLCEKQMQKDYKIIRIFLISILYWFFQFELVSATYLLLPNGSERFLSLSDGVVLRNWLYSLFGNVPSQDGLATDIVLFIFYACKKNHIHQAIAYLIWCLCYIVYNVISIPSFVSRLIGIPSYLPGTIANRALHTYMQWMMIFSIPFYFLYNGKRGKGFKKVFYIYYPVHIAVLYTIGIFISG